MLLTKLFALSILSLSAQTPIPMEGTAVGISLPRKWTQCTADAQCMLISFECQQLASPRREHEEAASKYLRKRKPNNSQAKCKPQWASAIFARCRRKQCIAVQFPPAKTVCHSRSTWKHTTLSAEIHSAKKEKDCLNTCRGELGEVQQLAKSTQKSPVEFICSYKGREILSKTITAKKS